MKRGLKRHDMKAGTQIGPSRPTWPTSPQEAERRRRLWAKTYLADQQAGRDTSDFDNALRRIQEAYLRRRGLL